MTRREWWNIFRTPRQTVQMEIHTTGTVGVAGVAVALRVHDPVVALFPRQLQLGSLGAPDPPGSAGGGCLYPVAAQV